MAVHANHPFLNKNYSYRRNNEDRSKLAKDISGYRNSRDEARKDGQVADANSFDNNARRLSQIGGYFGEPKEKRKIADKIYDPNNGDISSKFSKGIDITPRIIASAKQ